MWMEEEHLFEPMRESITSSLSSLDATALREALNKGNVTPREVVDTYRETIEQCEPTVKAWRYLKWSRLEQQLDQLQAIPVNERGVLWGIPVAIKDVFDTADMPTGYGSSVYQNHQPVTDAACVARLRAADALVLGKTVSTEFAFWQAGATRNPVNTKHTPGGSSSGSAAAVAANCAALALGSQTAASTIRPAAYCGVIGFKPTYGLLSTVGVKALAASMDTVGLFARSVRDIKLLFNVLVDDNAGGAKNAVHPGTHVTSGSDTQSHDAKSEKQYTFRIFNEGELDSLSSAARLHFESVLKELDSLNVTVLPARPVKAGSKPLYQIQTQMMAFEARRDLAYEYLCHRNQISSVLKQFIAEGESVSISEWQSAVNVRAQRLLSLDDYFAEADILIMPSATDHAPLIEEGTGDPIMSRAWTFLGLPSISLPLLNAKGMLPFGVQLAAKPGQENLLLNIAEDLERRICQHVTGEKC